MADWKNQQYPPTKSWEEMQQDAWDRRHPITWKDKAYVGWMGFLLLFFGVATLVSLGFGLAALFS